MKSYTVVLLQGFFYENNVKKTYYRVEALTQTDPPRGMLGIEITEPIVAEFRPTAEFSSRWLNNTLVTLSDSKLKRQIARVDEKLGPGEWEYTGAGPSCPLHEKEAVQP